MDESDPKSPVIMHRDIQHNQALDSKYTYGIPVSREDGETTSQNFRRNVSAIHK